MNWQVLIHLGSLRSLSSFIFLFFLSISVSAEEFNSENFPEFERIKNFLHQPFRVRENLKVTTDETLGSLSSQTVNEVVFLNNESFRIRKELPFSHSILEFNLKDSLGFEMTPANRKIEIRSGDSSFYQTFIEAMLTPLRLAERWSLAERNINLDYWLKDLESRNTPLQNAEGDKIQIEKRGNGVLRITSTGKLILDNKGEVLVESVWEISNQGQISEKDLNESLMMRSF